ncbi:probable carboxylesterase 2 [Nicotiana tomentosiformis]|uniref:probable carboxylesterase 2 n=1 Tax=Nicotiana tomentosiformis TaxID=4098 RepID=UPI00051C165C|nr:probable carboxylesterase 2 [Nicotiana tomentosiformis]
MDTANNLEIVHDIFPYLQVYKNGTVKRLVGTEFAPATYDPQTGVYSKDILVNPKTGVSARIYRPNSATKSQKLPLVVYFHGGAFCISSVGDPKYHDSLNVFVSKANVVLVSVDYRLVPEHPLPTAYEDSWSVLKWVAAHNSKHGSEVWLNELVNFDSVFLAGDSAGANISHFMAIRAGKSDEALGMKFSGMLMISPYFWGEKPIGIEVKDPRKAMVDKWWEFVCPSDKGNDDPLINPFVDEAPKLEEVVCDRILICVAEMDILRDRGILYYESLLKSQWKGKAEIIETKGEDHVFHIFNPTSEKALDLVKCWAVFINEK